MPAPKPGTPEYERLEKIAEEHAGDRQGPETKPSLNRTIGKGLGDTLLLKDTPERAALMSSLFGEPRNLEGLEEAMRALNEEYNVPQFSLNRTIGKGLGDTLLLKDTPERTALMNSLFGVSYARPTPDKEE